MVVAITGAGISKASGIPTFEERDDLRERLTRKLWDTEPQMVWAAIKEMEALVIKANPNAAHIALAEHNIPIVTQNIDGLHQRAGSRCVIEIHGNLKDASCEQCGRQEPLQALAELTRCSCGTYLKPTVVLYGEDVCRYWDTFDLIGQATLLLVIGTSLQVRPMAAFPSMAARNGAKTIYINKRAETELPTLLDELSERSK